MKVSNFNKRSGRDINIPAFVIAIYTAILASKRMGETSFGNAVCEFCRVVLFDKGINFLF